MKNEIAVNRYEITCERRMMKGMKNKIQVKKIKDG